MIEIYVFGWLVMTLAGGLSIFFLVTALLSFAFLGATGAALLRASDGGLRALPAAASAPRRTTSRMGIAVAAAVLILALSGVRVGMDGAAASLIATCAVTLALAAASGAAGSFFGFLGAQGLAALSHARHRQRALAQARHEARTLELQVASQRFLEGGDLRDQVLGAEASLQKLRAAIQSMEAMREGIARKIEAAPPIAPGSPASAPGSPAAGGLREHYARVRNDIDVKIDLGRRVLIAAEAAAFRLACAQPLRTLLRRRPSEAMKSLGQVRDAAELEAQIAGVTQAVQGFLDQIPHTREALSVLKTRRPPAMTHAQDGDGEAAAHADGTKDPLDRACLDLDAIESAYRNILERIEVIRLQFATRTEMEQLARAAGSVTASAETLGHGESDLGRLVEELGRAESAITIVTPENTSLQAFSDALARSAVALDCNDATTLAELIEAMREIG